MRLQEVQLHVPMMTCFWVNVIAHKVSFSPPPLSVVVIPDYLVSACLFWMWWIGTIVCGCAREEPRRYVAVGNSGVEFGVVESSSVQFRCSC